jgi:hypothetical protein
MGPAFTVRLPSSATLPAPSAEPAPAKSLGFSVSEDGIEPPTRGFSIRPGYF